MAEPRVAVVVITFNRRREADAALSRLELLPEQPQVILVDNGSTDGTAEMVRERHPKTCLLTPGSNLGAVARNLGVALVDAPYVAFCDDDTWWEPGSLTRAADVLDQHPRLAVLTADIRVEPGDREDPICRGDAALAPPPHRPGSRAIRC